MAIWILAKIKIEQEEEEISFNKKLSLHIKLTAFIKKCTLICKKRANFCPCQCAKYENSTHQQCHPAALSWSAVDPAID